MRFVQHVDLEPGWPEFGFTAGGQRIRLADVEEAFAAGSDERAGVYFLLEDGRTKSWPWKEAGHYVDDEGEVIAPVGRLPMPRSELEGMGMTDEKLFAEHAAYYPEPAVQPHPHGVDTFEVQQLRRRVFDDVMDAWYSDPPKPRLHPGG